MIDNYFEYYTQQEISNPEYIDGTSHTMVEDEFISYVTGTKFSKSQKETLNKWIKSISPVIKVFGAYEGHMEILLKDNYSVKKKIERESKSQKMFNCKRPFFIEVENIIKKEEELWIIVFPSKEYVEQYSELVNTYCHLYIEEKQLAKKDIKIETIHFPKLELGITIWTNFKDEIASFIEKGDFVVLGHVTELQSNILKTETCEIVLDFEPLGLDDLFGISIVNHKLTNKRCIFIGFKHSYWGSASGLISKAIAECGAKTIMYIAKAGTFISIGTIYKSVSPQIYSIIEKNKKTEKWETNNYGQLANQFDFFKLLDSEIQTTGIHLTVPTVIGETYSQAEGYNQYRPGTVDNEIGYIAKHLKEVNSNINFFCIHFITDYLHSKLDKEYKNISKYGLADKEHAHKDIERKKNMSVFLEKSAKEIIRLIPVYGIEVNDDFHLYKEMPLTNLIQAIKNDEIILRWSDNLLFKEEYIENFNNAEWAILDIINNDEKISDLSTEKIIDLALVYQKYGYLKKASGVCKIANKKESRESACSLMLLVIKFKINIQQGFLNEETINFGNNIIQSIDRFKLNQKFIPSIYNRIAICYTYIGNRDMALNSISESKKFYKEFPFIKQVVELNELYIEYIFKEKGNNISNNEIDTFIKEITNIQECYIKYEEKENKNQPSNVSKSLAVCLFVEGVIQFTHNPTLSVRLFTVASFLQKKSGTNSQAEGFAELLHLIKDKDLKSIVISFMDDKLEGPYFKAFKKQITEVRTQILQVNSIRTIKEFKNLRKIINRIN
ncbi:hypothetical protein VB264_15775 [Arcicella aquatica]|uniref:Uncharacterized protein n=1 Tax=Arcicella aquatica TaxID=217141 RepID=A0ABU5QQA2_9BACT|nr:hypothetical protein [Arcicella aquatica]MEA5259256.1 hypothetical protein [Arcicella aquatica]